jgi:non-specific serine/threonine protein kinase
MLSSARLKALLVWGLPPRENLVENSAPEREAQTIGAYLRKLRLERGLTQEELAERAGLSTRGISDLERGIKPRPRSDTVRILADTLGLNARDRAHLDHLRHASPAGPPARGTPASPPSVSRPGLPRRQHNLPAQLSGFVGREPELAEVTRLLPTTRLLTLVGSAGAGKTRLALRVAESIVDQYPDGVWLVELAPLADPTLVAKAVADALAVPEHPGRSLRDSLANALRQRQLLLVLDNCEHLVQACAELVEALLRACPNLRVLATSRQSLHVTGETTWRVPSMGFPPPEGPLSLGQLAEFDAPHLFVERVKATSPHFAVSEQNQTSIARICARLDGIPLAIELAAARVAALGLDPIAERLNDRLKILGSGSRAALPRQQTLRAALDWSHDLLSEPERVLFRRLAVFSGGWTLEAAEAVCSEVPHDPTPAFDVLSLLAELVDKSLVIVDETGGSVRYRFLETMREYGWEKLRLAGEEETIHDRHGAWFMTLAEGADAKIRGAEQAMWLTRLEVDHDNLRAALTWFLAGERAPAAALRLAGALAWFWRIHGYLSEGRRWLDRALASPGLERSPARPRALNGAGLLAWAQGDGRSTTALLEASLALARDLGDPEGIAWSLHGLGRVFLTARDFERADQVLEASLISFRERQDVAGCTYSLLHLANVARERADYARAATLFAETLGLARKLDDNWVLGWALTHAANVPFLQADYPRAAALYREGLAVLSRIRAIWGMDACLYGLAGVAGEQGQPERSARLFGAQEALRTALGTLPQYPSGTGPLGGLAKARAVLGDEIFDALAAEGQAMSLEEAVAYALAPEAASPDPAWSAAGTSSPSKPSPLTRREREVITLIARGLGNREIAQALVITPRTVDTHVMNIFAKLDLHSRAQAAVWASEHGLLPEASRHC